jgi:Zn finger protein HypA/HybF involved in hydrogenase expression
LGDDLLVAASPDEPVLVGEFEETATRHVYDLGQQDLDENRLRCPKCGSAELRIFEPMALLLKSKPR